MLRRSKSRNEPSSSTASPTTPNAPLSPAARSNSWTALRRRKSVNSEQASVVDPSPPTPPSPAGSSTPDSASSHDTVTPPARALASTLATLASPSTYYKPAARLFQRPGSSSGSSSRPSTASSLKISPFSSLQPPPAVDIMSVPNRSTELPHEHLDIHAQQLILQAIERTKSANQLARTESRDSNSTRGPADEVAPSSSLPPPPPHILAHSATAPGSLGPTSAPAGKSSSWFGFGGGSKEKDEKRLSKDEKRKKERPASEIFTSTPLSVPGGGVAGGPGHASGFAAGVGGMKAPSVKSGRPNSMPLAPSPQVAAALKSIGLPSTIHEGVPLVHSATMESTASGSEDPRGRQSSRRNSSPFRGFRSSRSRNGGKREKSAARSPSPAIHALKLSQSDVESDGESLGTGIRLGRKRKSFKVRNSAFDERVKDDDEEADEADDDEDEDDSWGSDDDEDDEDDDDGFDPLTTQNTEANAGAVDVECAVEEGVSFPGYDDDIELPDPLGEGVNVIRPEEPLFARTLMLAHTARPTSSPARTSSVSTSTRHPKRKKTTRSQHDPLPLVVSRPNFARDRCTVVIRHGDPDGDTVSMRSGFVAEPQGEEPARPVWKREPKRYVVFSDLSEESRWAVEWGIGTVLRDGDEMILVSVQETDSKLDPVEGANVDRMQKLRNQQERQALASLLVKQATSLLQRTRLHTTVTCQAMHAKNVRRLFLDIIDLIEPTMVIVGSRGLGKLKGILLGSTSHYLIQKSSVPVMVARRRLKRPTKKSHTAAQAVALRSQKRVSLADAQIEKVSSGQGKGATGVDVEDIQKDHERAEKEWPQTPVEGDEESSEEDELGAVGASSKVPGA